jgi:cytochrome bd-type quinol oxidase subunit 1
MNYPIWELTTIGGASLIALISVVHVYVAHLAVGGGLFIWLTDLKGSRENNPEIRAYVKKHTWFFLLLTMVFGGLTGVGIWFIIGLVHPAATSKLIHSFVFGWAIEWVFFLGEITALLIYHYKFDQLKPKARLNIAFLYFLFAWLSLFVINGILAFMLTPGGWLETQDFWAGFFNPTFLPSLLFRTFITIMFAGLFGYVTVVFMKKSEFRTTMMRYCSKWLLVPAIGLIPTGIYYYYTVPAEIRHTALVMNPDTSFFVTTFIVTSILIFIIGIFLSLRTNPGLQKVITFVLLVIGLFWMGGFEYIRETARKPFVINNYIYSTAVLKEDVGKLNAEGMLPHSKWTAVKEITADNKMEAGKELFNIQCLRCHTIGGIRNDILPKTEHFTYLGMMAHLTGQGKVNRYMPPFVGTKEEKEALAQYITAGFHKKEIVAKPVPTKVPALPETEIPPFDMETDEYILLVWNNVGMRCLSDCDQWFMLLPPNNTLEAQLFKRGETPELVTEGVELTYAVEPGFENPSKHIPLWEYAESNLGKKPEKDVGLKGFGMKGTFALNENGSSFIAPWIPAVPYKDDGTYNPYPLFAVEAKDKESGKVLAATKVVAPTSTEMGCRNCHSGGWRWNNVSGVTDETAVNILKAHDRISKTSLYREALAGRPQKCQDCHADPSMQAKGNSGLLNLSAAMHGFHANYMPVEGADACALCHPTNPEGNTRCYRGIHSRLGITCDNCHGMIQDHAISLLKAQEGKKGQQQLLKYLQPRTAKTKEEINPRGPWVNEPDCLNCHVDFEKPEEGYTGFNRWTESRDELYRFRTGEEGSIRCEACHSSPHAEYPAFNPLSKYRDVIQPMQYSNMPYPIGSNLSCKVCHTIDMEEAIHHENMAREVRNKVEDL